MNSAKFYKFVKDIAGADTILAESVIEAHKLIYGDTLTEGKLGKALATAGLGLGLMGAAPQQAHAGLFGGGKAKTEMATEQTAESVKAQTQKYLQSIGDDFIETNSFMDSENIEKLANYINSLPEDLKNFAISECGKFKNQFRLGTPSDNIVTALKQYNVAMR